MRRLAILGSTGSIGRQALEVVDAHPGQFQIVALAARSNAKRLWEQAWKYRPALVGLVDPGAASAMGALPEGTRLVTGPEALTEPCFVQPLDEILISVVGIAGLPAVMAALETRAVIALANKEALVAGGALVKRAGGLDGRILTVDSEHSAIWQCLRGLGDRREAAKLILTASGGPFRTWSKERIAQATKEDALAHPTWRMGPKITLDCATLMNKGLEVIEAHWLFGMPADRIEVLVQPQSIVHSLVACADGAVLAQLSVADMRLPIQYALLQGRREAPCVPPLDLAALGALTFERPDTDRFPCLALAYQALHAGGMAPAVLNAANEAAVEACLDSRMKLLEVPYVIGEALSRFTFPEAASVQDVLAADGQVRRWVRAQRKEV